MSEIQEEEHDIILDLEDLVEEFVKGYATYSYELRGYIEDVVWPRMEGFRKGKMTENELDELHRIGVVVNEQEDEQKDEQEEENGVV